MLPASRPTGFLPPFLLFCVWATSWVSVSPSGSGVEADELIEPDPSGAGSLLGTTRSVAVSLSILEKATSTIETIADRGRPWCVGRDRTGQNRKGPGPPVAAPVADGRGDRECELEWQWK